MKWSLSIHIHMKSSKHLMLNQKLSVVKHYVEGTPKVRQPEIEILDAKQKVMNAARKLLEEIKSDIPFNTQIIRKLNQHLMTQRNVPQSG